MSYEKLNVGDFGAKVTTLQANLKKHGFTISVEEEKRQFFGPTTREAVGEFQKVHGIDPTCEVCIATAAKLEAESVAIADAETTAVASNTIQIPPSVLQNIDFSKAGQEIGSKVDTLSAIGAAGVGAVTLPPSSSQTISGRIILEYGLPASKIKVRLYERGLGGNKTLLKEVETTESGDYGIDLMGGSNVEIHVVSSDNREIQLSETKFGLQTDEKIDLIAPSTVQPLAAEFTRLTTAVAPHIGGNIEALKDSIERDEQKDFSFLANKTGWDRGALAFASVALSLAEPTKIPAEGLYAMARVGLPMDIKKLANVQTQTISTVLRRASSAGIMNAAAVETSIKAFSEFAADYRFNNRIIGAVSSPKDFIGNVQLTDTDRTAFISVVRDESTEKIWERAKAAGVSDAGIEKLKIQGKLAYLTFNNAELVTYLESQISTSPLELIGLGYYEDGKWKDALNQIAGEDKNRLATLVPTAFLSGAIDQRVETYTAELSRRVRQMDPHAVTVDRIATAKMDAIPDADNVGRFLKNATGQGFRLGKTPLSNFISKNSSSVWNEIAPEKQETTLATVRKLSSLYSVSPDDDSMNALLAAGFSSATEIAKYDYFAFHERIQVYFPTRPKAGDLDIKKNIYWKAQQQAATVFNVFDGLKRLNNAPYAPGSTPEDTKQRDDQVVKVREKLAGLFPTLETLFGSVDYCECDQCQSVLSPAAYLVDILAFIDPKEETWATMKGAYKVRTGADYTKRKPFDVLNERRPDIKNIALTCENTNVALPHIDLVNEILEQLMMSDETMLTIDAYDVGEASSQDLLAEPQNILWDAYVGKNGKPGLRDLVYPISLPFDFPLELVRAFLKQLDLPLWRLRKLLARPSSIVASSATTTDGWRDVWFERLGISPGYISALTRSDNWHTLYGYKTMAEALAMDSIDGAAKPAKSSLRNAKTLARRLGVSYEELVELIRTRFINPEIEALIILNRLGIDAHTLDRYFGEGTPLSDASRTEFEASLKLQGVQANDLGPLRTSNVRQTTLVLHSPSVGCDFSLTTLDFDQKPDDPDNAISLVFLKLNAFVRLQRKLGWDIHELDRALMALMPNVLSLSFQTWTEAINTVICYLAHVEEIREQFEDRISREEILVLWSNIPTTGMSCLYERLFMGYAALERDPVFKKHLGSVLMDAAKIADHVDGIRQALHLAEDEIEPILQAGGATDRKLSIENLSILMRHSVLAQGLELTVAELLSLLSLSERKPLSPLDNAPLTDLTKDVPWNETLAFLKEVELIREAGSDVALVERICRHRGITDEPNPENDPVCLAVLALPHAESTTPEEQKNISEKQSIVLIQTLAAQLTIPEGLVNNLLSNVLLDDTGKPLKETGFSDPDRIIVSLRRLRKALDLIQSLGITDDELGYLNGVTAALNLNDLPITEVTSEETARKFSKGLAPWLEIAGVRKHFGRSERLLAVISAAKQPIDTANPIEEREKILHEALAALTGLKVPWLASVLETIGIRSIGATVFEVPALNDPMAVRQTIEALKSFVRIGLNPGEVVKFASMPVDEKIARKIRSSLKGRYSPSAWRHLVKPIFDDLRKKQRDALVAHLTHLVKDDGNSRYGDTLEKLFEYLLIDPGMEPVVVASRIQVAIGSVQLFVQRCLMNLEPEGVDPQIIDTQRWEWMRRYRVWEVNRKMFIWPENWLDPEFRDDKSHIFRELEGKLLEGDVNDELVRSAVFDYLKGLEQIARLEMLTMYFETGASADSSIIHVVGRTQHAPHKYFYRKVSHGMWTPWEPIEVGIEGAHLVLTSWRGRMYLFWAAFLEEIKKNPKTPTTFKPSTDSVEASSLCSTTNVKIQLHWVEKINGKWMNRSSIPGFVETAFDGLKATTDDEKKAFFIRAVLIQNGKGIEDDDLEIHITNSNMGHKFRFYSKLAPPKDNIKSAEAPPTPPFVNIEGKGTKWKGNGALQVNFISAVVQNSQSKPSTDSGNYTILGRGGEFSLLGPSNDALPIPSRTPPNGIGRPTGFIFGPQNAQHVAYRTSDGSISDIFWTKNGWFYQSPSADASSTDPNIEIESATSDPHGYAIDARGLLCLAYTSATKVYELVWSQLDSTMADSEHLATGWHIETLYIAPTVGEQPQGRPFGGMFLPQRGVVFRTKDGKLRAAVESPAGTWETKELKTGLPEAVSEPTGLIITKTELGITTILSRHIIYLGTDGDIHELYSDIGGENWDYKNITQSIPGIIKPDPGSSPSAYAFQTQQTLHIVYRGTDDRIHELWGFPGSWNYNPVGANFTKAKGDPFGYVTEQFSVQHIVYRGENDQIVELWWFGIWREHILSNTVSSAPLASSDPVGYSFESMHTQHVVYFSQDGSLQELYWSNMGWYHGTYCLQNPFPPNSLAALASPFFYESLDKDHTFFIEPFVVETTVHEWTDWIVTTREYVEPKIYDFPLHIVIPDAVAVAPSAVSIIKTPLRFSKELFNSRAIIRTPKGIIEPLAQSEAITSEATLSATNIAPSILVDVSQGFQPSISRVGREIFLKGGLIK